ncbi:MAG: hypothetical protein PVF15_03330 [Candidatus Bathyarchaeota archaeon]|jgi:hypothetical protein
MSDGWTREKRKTPPRTKREWLIDSGLVFVYSFFMTLCFFIFILPRVWGQSGPITWGGVISVLLVVLFSPYISFILKNFRRTIMIFFLSFLLGSAVIAAVPFPAEPIFGFPIGFFFISILGAIVGSYIAGRTGKGEKKLTLRCTDCGTWNEPDAIHCSHCGMNLHGEYVK